MISVIVEAQSRWQCSERELRLESRGKFHQPGSPHPGQGQLEMNDRAQLLHAVDSFEPLLMPWSSVCFFLFLSLWFHGQSRSDPFEDDQHDR